MKTLLRSCIVVDPTKDKLELFGENYHYLVESCLGFEHAEDNLIWNYVQDFFKAHGHVPNIQTVIGHYASIHESDVVDRAERLALIPPKTRGDFVSYLEEKATDRRNRTVQALAKTAIEIVSTGLEVKDDRGKSKKLSGALDAIRYILDKSHDIVAPTLGAKLSGNIMQDGISFLDRYDRIKADPLYGIGSVCGIDQIDGALKGAKRYELWVHAGFTGSLKSTWAIHWAYIQAVYYGNSSIYFSLEMPYVQVRNMLYAIHSGHEDFNDIREELGIVDEGLDYEKIRDGKLSPQEEILLKKYVVPSMNGEPVVPLSSPDLLDPRDYGSIYVEVPDPDKTDFTIVDLRSRAELIFSKTPFHLIFIDHAGLLSARGRYSNTTERLNEVIRDLKKMAMSFNRGMGIAVVVLFQISREGYRAAEKNAGKYNLTHLSYANECVAQGTLIPTNGGILPIETVLPGDLVWSRSGWREVLYKFDQGPKPLWEVQTECGSILEATENHRIRVLSEGDICWKDLRNLRVGDHVLSTYGNYPWPTEIPATGRGPLTEELAYLLGAWDGDGRYRPNKIAFTGNRAEAAVLNRLKQSFLASFQEELFHYEFESRAGAFDLESKANVERTQWFESLAGPRGNGVPRIIFQATRELALMYLKGLWDTDGWITSANVVGIKMKSKDFLLEIQQLLVFLGYESKLEPAETAWTLRIRGYDSRKKFSEEIGFTEPWKQARLLESVAEVPMHKQTDQTYPVSDLYLALYDQHIPYHLISSGVLPKSMYNSALEARKKEVVPRQAIVRMLGFLDEQGITDPRKEILRHIISLKVSKVVSVRSLGQTDRVYDLEVDGDHEYQTGAFLSHNCERSADIVTTTWIDDSLRRMGRALFQCLKSRDQAPFERVPVKVVFKCRRFAADHTDIKNLLDAMQKERESEQTPQTHDKKKPIKKKPAADPDFSLESIGFE